MFERFYLFLTDALDDFNLASGLRKHVPSTPPAAGLHVFTSLKQTETTTDTSEKAISEIFLKDKSSLAKQRRPDRIEPAN